MMTIFSDMAARVACPGTALQIGLFPLRRRTLEQAPMTAIASTFRSETALPDLAATAALAGRIAPLLRAGDAVALWGGLGVGKTTLARDILRALGVTENVPSPTFTLMQSYETPRLNVAHYDLYRLKRPRELEELGLREALEDGAVLLEWPERAPDYLPDETLHLRLSLDGETRLVKITGPERWAAIA
jgi:tRNA threonylcarbamoyl adenosine modification protein YjeE